MDYSPWGHKESDMTEQFSLMVVHIRVFPTLPEILHRLSHQGRAGGYQAVI